MLILNFFNYDLPKNLDKYFDKIFDLFLERFFLEGCEVEISVVDEKSIKELNFLYRNKDYCTDVLSFPLKTLKNEKFLGAIYFCYPEIKKNNKNLLFEFCFLFIHSCLHLLGYEHGKEMFDIQDEIINKVFVDKGS